MMPVSGECSAPMQDNSGSSARAALPPISLQAFDAVDAALRFDRLDLVELGLVGGDDQLAAFVMRHAVRGAKFVQHAPAAHAVARAQRAGRVVHAAMDDLAVARGDAGADGIGRFRHHHLVALARHCARHRQADHAGSNHQDLHAGVLSRRRGRVCFTELPLIHHLHKNRPYRLAAIGLDRAQGSGRLARDSTD